MFWVEALITATQSFTHGISIFGYLAMFFFIYLPMSAITYVPNLLGVHSLAIMYVKRDLFVMIFLCCIPIFRNVIFFKN